MANLGPANVKTAHKFISTKKALDATTAGIIHMSGSILRTQFKHNAPVYVS